MPRWWSLVVFSLSKNLLLSSRNSPFCNSEYTHSTHGTHISQTQNCRWESGGCKTWEKLGPVLTEIPIIELIMRILYSGWKDLNLRPPAPKAGTPLINPYFTTCYKPIFSTYTGSTYKVHTPPTGSTYRTHCSQTQNCRWDWLENGQVWTVVDKATGKGFTVGVYH